MDFISMQALPEQAVALGADRASIIPVSKIQFERSFRSLCENNACGKFGKCWMCPPDIGEIDELIARAKNFQHAVVYQTVGTLEDSFDFDGMMAAGDRQHALSQKISEAWASYPFWESLHLSAGGCRMCERCARLDALPCRFPDKALAGLETYGIAVTQLAQTADMKYNNGPNTVSYFGAYLFSI